MNRDEHDQKEQMAAGSLNSFAWDGMTDGSVIGPGFRHISRTGKSLYGPTAVKWQKRSANSQAAPILFAVVSPPDKALPFSHAGLSVWPEMNE